MQSSLHDPYARLTKTERELAEARRARLQRIASNARSQLRLVATDTAVEKKPFDLEAWRERRERIHPIPKEPWFEIVGEIETQTKAVRIRDIQRLVAKEYQISITDMLSARRTLSLTIPRQIGYYLSKMLTMKSLPGIGRHFRRDNTSVLSGIKKIERLRRADPSFDEKLRKFAADLGGRLA